MKKASEKRHINKINLAKNCNIFGIFCRSTKRHLRADGLSLLPSALRPRLVGSSSTKSASFSFVAVVIFSLLFSFFLQTSYALNVSAASLTLTIPSAPLSLDISPIKESNFQKSSTSSISVKTDSESGYTLSIKSKNSDKYDKLINGTNKLDSISFALSESDYQNTGALNTWGWLPSKLNGEDNSNFLPSPKNSEETILDITEEKNDTSSNTYDITLAAKVDQTIAPGNYTNTFVITSIANPPKYKKMQEFTVDDCASLTQHDGSNGDSIYTTLVDERDGNEYKVAKLKDGKCWMVENLRLGGEQPIEISSENSDLASGSFTIPASNLSAFRASPDTVNNSAAYIDRDNTYGGYYNLYTATAGTGNSSIASADVNVMGSICPKGWKLPSIGSSWSGDYADLIAAYGGKDSTGFNNLLVTPVPGFTYGGYVFPNTGVLFNQGGLGYYWSSTSSSNTEAYYLYLPHYNNNPAHYTRVFGNTVRCVQKEKTMQDVSNWGTDLQVGDSIEVKDVRDNNKYSVSKLADGRIWMTSNLRIAGQTLNSETSDVGSNYELPASDMSRFYTRCEDTDGVYIDSEYGGYYTQEQIIVKDTKSTYSICPKGWRPPTQTEFETMVQAYNSDPLQLQLSAKFTFNGYILKNALTNTNNSGNYWTSTAAACGGQMYFNITNDSLKFTGNEFESGKDMEGAALRCIARESNGNYDGSDRVYTGSFTSCAPTGTCAETKV